MTIKTVRVWKDGYWKKSKNGIRFWVKGKFIKKSIKQFLEVKSK